MRGLISKSMYMRGLQCPKLLWYCCNRPDALPPLDPGVRARFEEGHEVGEVAKQLLPRGVQVGWNDSVEEDIAQTLALVNDRRRIFEGCFVHGGAYCRADLMAPVSGDGWDLLEVKSSTETKDVHLPDLAFQRYVIESSGIPLRYCKLVVVNNEYVRRGPIDAFELFKRIDVTGEIEALRRSVPGEIDRLQEVIAGPEPMVNIGRHCLDPYLCPLKASCWGHLPEHNVTELYRINKARAFDYLNAGVQRIVDVAREDLTPSQQVQQEAIRSGRVQVDREAVRGFLSRLEYPLYMLDFETVSSALPLFDGTRPYQQIPFQFSLHVLDAPDADPRHQEFLYEQPDDPRAAVADALSAIGERGTVLAYHAAFERGVIRDLAQALPDFANVLESVDARLLDLAEPFRSFWFYHPDQHGSCSIKAVLPALTGSGYDGLEIGEGTLAAQEYARVTYGQVSKLERERVYRSLLAYCAKDTQAMVDVLRVLRASA